METVIKVTPAELNSSLLEKIKSFIGAKQNVDITISFSDSDDDYVDTPDRSIEQAESNEELISMTMEEFVAYNPKGKQSETLPLLT